jgi:hypothetical protein
VGAGLRCHGFITRPCRCAIWPSKLNDVSAWAFAHTFPTREAVERRHSTINILDCRIITHFPGSDDVVESEHRAGSLRHTLSEVYT